MSEDRQSEDRQTRETLLAGPAELLLWLHAKGATASLGEARRELGSKAYNHAYKLALAGLLEIKDKKILLTDKGKKIAECLSQCFS